MDMSNWGEGPWLDEPDTLKFEAEGYQCFLNRADASGSWNGYVILPKEHPLFSCKDYDDERITALDVHGGITFCEQGKVPQTNEDSLVLGFDTAHCYDYSPKQEAFFKEASKNTDTSIYFHVMESIRRLADFPEKTYKTMQWVRAETERLAAQCKAIENEEAAKERQ